MTAIKIGNRKVGDDAPCYIIAEVSCNHEGDFNEARRIIETAAQCGADAAKIQTYTADTMTRNFNTRPAGTMWADIDLYQLYQKAQTPWSWHKDLKKVADDCGIHLFSSPFDEKAVDHLVSMGVPVLKAASFELVDVKLLEKMAQTGLPIIMSNGMTDYLEMEEAVRTFRQNGNRELAILHCNSGYPASFDEANLLTMPVIESLFGVVPGVSDHTLFVDDVRFEQPMAHVTPVEAVRLGAKIIEIHLLLDRAKARELNQKKEGGFDWPFSREPAELRKTVEMIRIFEKSGNIEYETEEERRVALRTHGKVSFDPTPKEMASRAVRPSLWVVEPVRQGQAFKFSASGQGNFDSIRPAGGVHIRFADFIEGKTAARDLPAGLPLSWDMIDLGS